MEDLRIRGVSEHGVVIVRGVTHGWVAALREAGFERRNADLAAPALCKVAVLSMVEARRVNDAFLARARAELATVDAEKGTRYQTFRHLYTCEVDLGAAVAALLDTIEKDFLYYPSWVVVEGMNID